MYYRLDQKLTAVAT